MMKEMTAIVIVRSIVINTMMKLVMNECI